MIEDIDVLTLALLERYEANKIALRGKEVQAFARAQVEIRDLVEAERAKIRAWAEAQKKDHTSNQNAEDKTIEDWRLNGYCHALADLVAFLDEQEGK